ncbi:MAG: HAD family hydrolase [Patescibacteria group bacterium]
MKPKLLLIDRDGTLCEAMPRGQYLIRLEQFKLLPGVPAFLRSAKTSGCKIAVITNQPQISRGMMELSVLEQVHERMKEELSGMIDAIYFCPHQDSDQCNCRKPKPGMLLQGLKDFGVSPEEAMMIGDSDRDVLAGQAAGCRTVFIRDEQNAHELARCKPEYVVDSLSDFIPLL